MARLWPASMLSSTTRMRRTVERDAHGVDALRGPPGHGHLEHPLQQRVGDAGAVVDHRDERIALVASGAQFTQVRATCQSAVFRK